MAFVDMQLMEEGSFCIQLELQEEAVLYIYELHAIYVIESCKIEINFMQFM
jgi:hypothetical protein